MNEQNERLYYIVDEKSGRAYCIDGSFHLDGSNGTPKAYRRYKAALACANQWSRYMKRTVRVVDNEGNEVAE